MLRIVRTRTLRRLRNRAVAEQIKRQASDNTAASLLNLRDDFTKAKLLAGMPEDASIHDLIRWHREHAAAGADVQIDTRAQDLLIQIAQDAEAILSGGGLGSSCAIRIRDRAFDVLGAKTPEEQMDVLRAARDRRVEATT